MFVKWAKRKINKQQLISLDAILVENQWQNGKVKQRYISYLGSIQKHLIKQYGPLRRFWISVDKNLQRLGLTFEQKQFIIQTIQKKLKEPNT